MKQSDLTLHHVTHCRLEDLQRLCNYLQMPPGGDGLRKSLVSWLYYMDYLRVPFRSMYG